MPFGDGTGPLGLGPMTGRRAGFCAGFGRPGFTNPMPGRWFGFGWRMPYPGWYGAPPYYGYPYYGGSYTPYYGYPYPGMATPPAGTPPQR